MLLFVGQRAKCDEVTAALTAAGVKAAAIHGDMDQVGAGVGVGGAYLLNVQNASVCVATWARGVSAVGAGGH